MVELKQSLKISQSLVLTPQLQLSIKMLQMSRLELEEFVSEQVKENPVIDHTPQTWNQIIGDQSTKLTNQGEKELKLDLEIPNQDSEFNKSDQELSKELSFEYGSEKPTHVKGQISNQDYASYDQNIKKEGTLGEHLLGQLFELELSVVEKELAAYLIGNIDDNGYLDLNIEDLAQQVSMTKEQIEDVIDIVQRLDPPGIGARTMQECLLIQIRELGLSSPLRRKLLAEYFQDFLKGTLSAAQLKKLGISQETLNKEHKILARLNPYPARQFLREPTVYAIPDIYVTKFSGKWKISLNDDSLPVLKINKFYKNLKTTPLNSSDKKFLSTHLNSAEWLIKTLFQRQSTIFKVAQKILEKQRDFFDKGPKFIKPMTLKELASEVELHESTISRVTQQKYMHTPHGIFELKYFFSSGYQQASGEDVASESIKAMLKEFVSQEISAALSDEKLVEMLKQKGIRVARRTVAKYREQLGILSSQLRNKSKPKGE